MNITLVNSSLGLGGAERVISIMANYWANRGEKVTLVTMGSTDNDFYSLDLRIQRIGLDLMHHSRSLQSAIWNNVVRFRKMRYAIKESKPDVIISFQENTNVLTLLTTRGLKIPVLVSERSDPRYHTIGGMWHRLRRLTYPWARAVVVQTNAVTDWASEFIPIDKIHVIPNPVRPLPEKPEASPFIKISSPYVVAMGRLEYVKGFDILISAFAQCRTEGWSLVILGEGPKRDELESQIKKLGLESRVYLPGKVTDPGAILQQAAIFVLSSHYEGFPNALLEAMSWGLAVVSFDCPSGPRAIITDGSDGLLVPAENVTELSNAMDSLMTDEYKRLKLGSHAKKITQKYSLEKVMDMWDALIREAIG